MKLSQHYIGILKCDFALDFVALLILSLLILQYVRRKHRTFELTLFFQMCLVDLLMVLCSVAFDIIPIFWKVPVESAEDIRFSWYLVALFVDQLFSITLLAMWLLYVEFSLHQSRDLIRRRYPAAMAPFVAAVVMIVADMIMIVFWKNPPFDMIAVDDVLYLICQAILVFYIVAAYVVLYREKKRNRVPAYIKLTPTTLCVIAGFGIYLILPDTIYPVLQPCFALGLLFADYFMYRRLSNIDPDTGLFNRRYLSTLISFAKRKNLKGATIIRFKFSQSGSPIAPLLKSWEPELSKTIGLEDGTFLLISAPVKDSLAKRYIALLSEQAKNKGVPMESSFETDREAPLHEMLKKYL